MDAKELEKKWGFVKQLVQISNDEWADKSIQATALRVIKAKIGIAMFYLENVDKHDNEYQMPFTGKELTELINNPALTKNDIKKASDWCHESRLIRDKACVTWNF